MRDRWLWLAAAVGCVLVLSLSCPKGEIARSITVPFVLDHNRMLVDAEIQRADGSWRTARLWVDTGNPELFLSEGLARDLAIDVSARQDTPDGRDVPLEVAPLAGVRIGGMGLRFEDVTTKVVFEPRWLFTTMHIDANLPATVLAKYHVVFDYPRLEMTVAEPGTLEPRGERCSASVQRTTGIVQIDAVIDGQSTSFALDNGASYSFVTDAWLTRLAERHPEWPRASGALGCANMWGWWPDEPTWPLVRVPEIQWGSARLAAVGIVGLPKFFPGGSGVGEWYSQKSARPVAGFLGPNAFKAFRVEIDYPNGAVYFERGAVIDAHDMDLVGLTLRPAADGSYQVIGVATIDGRSAVPGVEPGDMLLEVDGREVTGATMGTVVDALRGEPGEARALVLDRGGERVTAEARVERFL